MRGERNEKHRQAGDREDDGAHEAAAAACERPGVLLQFVWETRPPTYTAVHGQIWRGFCGRRYKLTMLSDIEHGLRPWQFFDLQEDPAELCNLVVEPAYADLVARHEKWLRVRMRETGDHMPFDDSSAHTKGTLPPLAPPCRKRELVRRLEP